MIHLNNKMMKVTISSHAFKQMKARNVSEAQVLNLMQTGKVYNNARELGEFIVWDPKTELALFVALDLKRGQAVIKTSYRVWARELNYKTRGMVFEALW